MINWIDVKKNPPDKPIYNVLMCRIYVHDPTDPQLEHYYAVGGYSPYTSISHTGFVTTDNKPYDPHYYAVIEEPDLYKNMTTDEMIKDGEEFIAEMEQFLEELKDD